MQWVEGPGPTTCPEQRGRGNGLRGVAGVLALLLLLLGVSSPAAAFVTDPGTVIQTIDTSLWNPPSPDPSGITYRPDTGQLITCDAEVEEIVDGITHYHGVNVWTHSTTGIVTGTADTTWFSSEPTGCSFDPAGGRIFFSDDVKDSIFELRFGPDGIYGTPDDTQTRLRGYAALGCQDFEDVTYDSFDGHLYIADGPGRRICRIGVGANGVFNGAPPYGDDVLTLTSIASSPVTDAEGIVYDPFWDTLVIADRGTRDLYEFTPQGNFLRKIDVNFPGDARPSDVTIAPGSTNPSLRNYFVSDRHVDNNGAPNENDGRIFEVVAIPLGGNGAPIVDAGPPQTLQWPTNSANLAGYVSDDGHPFPPSTVSALWSKLSGPGSVSFGSPNQPVTTASFSVPGSYVLQLVGNDSQRNTTDTVTINVSQNVTLSATTAGPGSVTLDPPGGTYTFGQTVNVTAVPGPDAAFTGFAGALTGTTSPQPLVMNGDQSVTASFATLHDVTVDTTGPGTVTLSPPGGTYPADTVVTVTATPGASAVFDGFGGDLSGTTSPQLLTVDADKTISASFTQHYTVAVSTTGPGTVTLNPATGPYASGTVVEVTAVPSANAVFDAFGGDLTGTASPQLLTVDADKTVSASFTQHHTLALTTAGPGSVTLDPPGGSYPAGTIVSVSATPDPFAVFDGFGGDLTGTASPQLLTVDADKTVSASFTLPSYALTLTKQGQGTVTVDPAAGPYPAGSTVTLTAVPASTSWVFGGWSGDVQESQNPLLLVMDGSKSVRATFNTTGGGGVACGVGPELAALVPALGWLHRRRRRR